MNSGAENQPAYSALSGKTVFAAASAKLLPELASGLRAFGADVLAVAVLEAKELEDAEYAGALDRAITNIGGYDWIIFTSAWGVSFFAKRLARTFHEDPAGAAQAGISALRPLAANPDGISGMPSMANSVDAPPKICAIGPATAEAAKDHGFCVALTADEFTAEGIMRALERYYGGGENLRGLSFLIPRALEAREFLPAALASAGCRVDAIPCYQTVQPEPDAGLYTRLRSETPDLIVFTSPKAMRNFLKTAAEAAGESYARRCLREAAVAAIGPITAGALEAEGKSPEIVPSESTVPALLTAIARFFQNR